MTNLQTLVLCATAATLGWWAHSIRPVRADSPDLRFQFSGISPESALSVYSPNDQTIYVYQGATQGFSTLQCTYKFHIPRVGSPIERQNCPVGSIR